MAETRDLPSHAAAIDGGSTFAFACHQELSCFTECCRMLELALSPYDVLRSRRGTGLTSAQLLERYLIIEQDPGEAFPRLYLSMVDDGRASCVFVTPEGCSVYQHRPGACRTFPLGRGVGRCDESLSEQFVLIAEPFCQGFNTEQHHTPHQYLLNQETGEYNRYADRVAHILQHDAIRAGFKPSRHDVVLFLLLLYDLDTLRLRLRQRRFPEAGPAMIDVGEQGSDEELLDAALDLLPRLIFSRRGAPCRQQGRATCAER
jgi:uncharacterized protein